jgi:transcriptional regulator with XRE-family HTH domain
MSARPIRRRQTIFVGSKIRQLRKDRSLTQAELAQRIGVQQSDLCRMENGEYKVSLDTLFKILGVFGLDIGEFFHEDPASAGPADKEREAIRLFQRLDAANQEEAIEFLRFKCARSEPWRD